MIHKLIQAAMITAALYLLVSIAPSSPTAYRSSSAQPSLFQRTILMGLLDRATPLLGQSQRLLMP